MRLTWVVLSLLLSTCSATRSEHVPRTGYDGSRIKIVQASSRNSVILSKSHELIAAYILQGDCQNWNAALTIANHKMGCDGGNPPLTECQKSLPCDVCPFLKEGAWPPAEIVDFPAKKHRGIKNTIYGAVIWDASWLESCPIDDQTKVEFKWSLCSGEGVWGFDKIDTLAKAMVHEALHLCRAVGGTGSGTLDKGFWTTSSAPVPTQQT